MELTPCVLVHLRQLLQQWVERLSMFLDLPVNAIGRLGGGRKDVTGTLDVAVIQSLVRNGVVKDMVGDYGHLVVDECHHLSAGSFEQVARRAKAKFVTGLSATVARKDGSPVVLTERTEHLENLEKRLSSEIRHLIVFRGGMGRKALTGASARLESVPEDEDRVLLATGRFIGEGFDDARLDTLFLAPPVSWRGTIALCVDMRSQR